MYQQRFTGLGEITYTGISGNDTLRFHDELRLTFGIVGQEAWLPSIGPVRAADFETGMGAIYTVLEAGDLGVIPLTANPATGGNERGTVDVLVLQSGGGSVAELLARLSDASAAWFGLFSNFVGVVRVERITPAQVGVNLDAADTAAGRENRTWWEEWSSTALLVGVVGVGAYIVNTLRGRSR